MNTFDYIAQVTAGVIIIAVLVLIVCMGCYFLGKLIHNKLRALKARHAADAQRQADEHLTDLAGKGGEL